MKKLILVVMMSLMLIGCGPVEQKPTSKEPAGHIGMIELVGNSGLTRVIDWDAKVVCWVANSGISCIPMPQLAIDSKVFK